MSSYPLESLFGSILSPFERFLRRTTAGGLVLIGTTCVALVLAGFLGGDVWHHFWEQQVVLAVGDFNLKLSWRHVVNDGLMALFFLLVGLELKREVLVGELAQLRDAILPILAALGGMIVPALIYTAFNVGTEGSKGWGIPMATDIAFAVGILVLLAWRVPKNLVVFLTALAIADDLGAVLVIAIFYSGGLDLGALAAAGFAVTLLILLNRGGVRHSLPYAFVGFVLWYFLLQSGVHATLAGIALAAAIPARPAHPAEAFDARLSELQWAFHVETGPETPNDPLSNQRMASIAQTLEQAARLVQSPLQRIEHGISPWVTFIVIPVFALANAGVDLSRVNFAEMLSANITLGILFGLVLGKFIGITGFAWIAVRSGLARLPAGVSWAHLSGASWLGGIGFTMSLFIAQLAFADPVEVEQAKLGILVASLVSALAGLSWLIVAAKHGREPTALSGLDR